MGVAVEVGQQMWCHCVCTVRLQRVPRTQQQSHSSHDHAALRVSNTPQLPSHLLQRILGLVDQPQPLSVVRAGQPHVARGSGSRHPAALHAG